MGIPHKDDPKISTAFFVTAAHVLDDIAGDTASVLFRRRDERGAYASFRYDVTIRSNGSDLYVKHGIADVAVMAASITEGVPISAMPEKMLAEDQRIEELELHPGDEVFCLGFPLFATGPGGFPILRSGRIASYPLTPTKTVKEIYLDVLLHGGNSGGPVYYQFSERIGQSGIKLGLQTGMLGLVTQQANSAFPEFADKPLNFGVIVPASFLRETIDKTVERFHLQ